MSKPFSTAIIDPPWPYAGASSHKKLSGYVKCAVTQYETIPMKDLMSLPIGEIVTDYIFLWSVAPFVASGEASELLKSWGFIPRSMMFWHKNTGLGVGYWFRGDCEPILFASKKASPAIRTNERSLFASKRLRHSAKPDIVHELVEKHFPGPYLEIFGRRSRQGWTVLGNESPEDGKDIKEALQGLCPKV